jgi:hypothetical protein
MTAVVDWRKHPRFFRCRCDLCRAAVGTLTKPWGKLWLAGYGESNTDFRRRYLAFHRPGAHPT